MPTVFVGDSISCIQYPGGIETSTEAIDPMVTHRAVQTFRMDGPPTFRVLAANADPRDTPIHVNFSEEYLKNTERYDILAATTKLPANAVIFVHLD